MGPEKASCRWSERCCSKEEGAYADVAHALSLKDTLEVEREDSLFAITKSVRLLGAAAGIDKRPRVGCEMLVKGTGGVVKKWNVTVYDASEFEELRRQCMDSRARRSMSRACVGRMGGMHKEARVALDSGARLKGGILLKRWW